MAIIKVNNLWVEVLVEIELGKCITITSITNSQLVVNNKDVWARILQGRLTAKN